MNPREDDLSTRRRTGEMIRQAKTALRAGALSLILVIAAQVLAQERSIESCSDGQPTTAAGLPDEDSDTIPDSVDNCRATANTGQRDTDGDNIGNACDADLDNNGVVNAVDLGLLKSVFFDSEPELNADFDGDGAVTPADLAIMRASFHQAPGPVGACVAEVEACKVPALFEFDDVGEVTEGNLFVFRSEDPATVYHARRLLDGSSQCNPSISGGTSLGTQPWNPDWGFHMDGDILFHGSSVEPLQQCDHTAEFIQANLAMWCGDDSETVCRFWCPWRSRLTREVL